LELAYARWPLRPIRTRDAHRRGKAMLRSLAGKRSPAVRDYKTVLVSLVADYERTASLRLNTANVTPAEIVLHLLEERGMSVNALAKALGIPQSSLSETLHGRRGWSKFAIIRTANYFGLEPGLFLQ
jgi:antitoxin component HigA of HigAB toxin-antitoxin module